jgi:hypothetical protein
MADGSRLDFQLVEWLEAEQMRDSIRRERAEKDIVSGLLKHYPQPPPHLQSVVLEPKPGIHSPSDNHLARMVKEFGDLIARTSAEWPQHPEWDSLQGCLCRDLKKWPTMASYLSEVHFNVYGPDPDWIMFALVGGAYDPGRATRALCLAVGRKAAHYGAPDAAIPLDLIVHYSRAAAYNTPYHSIEIYQVNEVAKWLAKQMPQLLNVLGTCPFRRIFLLDERCPGPQVFLVYPGFQRPE